MAQIIRTPPVPSSLEATTQTSQRVMVPVPPILTVATSLVPVPTIPMGSLSPLEATVASRPTPTTRTSQRAMVLVPPNHTSLVLVPTIPMGSVSPLEATVASRPIPMTRTSLAATVLVPLIHTAAPSLLEPTVANRPTPTIRTSRVAMVLAPPSHMGSLPSPLEAMVASRPTPTTRTSLVAMVLVPLIHTAAPRTQAATAQSNHASMVPARPVPMAPRIAMGLVAETLRVRKVTQTRIPVTRLGFNRYVWECI